MLLKFNRNIELEVVGFGVYQPKKEIEVNEELGRTMLNTGYFDEIKVKNKLSWGTIKGKSKPFDDLPEIENGNVMIPKVSSIRSNIKIKKSKKKGDDK